MFDASRIQAQAGPVSDQALEGLIFRAAHAIVDRLAPYPAGKRAALANAGVVTLPRALLAN
jgi:hypothetical protein